MLDIKRYGLWGAIAAFSVHTLLATAVFGAIHRNPVAQAEFAWLWFMLLDFPTSYFAWEMLASTPPFRALFDLGYELGGSGPNLRAFAIHVSAGGVQWFLIGWLIGRLVARLKARSNPSLDADARNSGARPSA